MPLLHKTLPKEYTLLCFSSYLLHPFFLDLFDLLLVEDYRVIAAAAAAAAFVIAVVGGLVDVSPDSRNRFAKAIVCPRAT